MMKHFMILTAMILVITCAVMAQETNPPQLVVPTGDGTPVLLDGEFTWGEWADADSLRISDDILLRFKQYKEHFFLGIECPNIIAPVVDLFLAVDTNETLQLHAAAQLGERKWPAGQEPGEFLWGRTAYWYANEFRYNSPMTDSLVRVEGMKWEDAVKKASFRSKGTEYQIMMGKIPFDRWFFRLEVGAAGAYDKPTVFPAGTTADNLTGWGQFILKE
ncbi:MAG TPA: hypothetical protein PLF13_04120 [candidate division Zixibacteria bacterium]|nr:hypothetical protein [candidate division Zixibacteria bacterium]